MTHKSPRKRERSLLAEQDGWAAAERTVLDADGYPLPGPHADVIIRLEAGSTVDAAAGRSRWLRFIGIAPAQSPLGRTLATVPLSLLLSAPPFAMAGASALFVKVQWVTAVALFVGLGVGAAFALFLSRQRRAVPAPSATVVRSVVEHSPPASVPSPEP
jgi:hypothetical protein